MVVPILLAALISAPAAEDRPVHLGVGWTASQAAATAEVVEHQQAARVAKQKTPPVLPRAGIRPASTLDAIKQTRRARAFAIGTAMAVQGAMIVYGIMSLIEQQREAEALRSGFRPFNPYPR